MKTIVTFLFDYERLTGSEYLINDYLKSSDLLKCPLPMYIFAEQPHVEKIKSLRGNYPTKIVEFKIEETEYFRHFDKVQALYQMGKTGKLCSTRKNQIYLVMMSWSKMWALDQAIKDNPFKSETFIWSDFDIMKIQGVNPKIKGHYFTPDEMGSILQQAPTDKIKLMMLMYYSPSHFEDRKKYYKNYRWVGVGGLMSFPKKIFPWFKESFDLELEKMIEAEVPSYDEQLIPIIVSHNPEMFSLYFGDYHDLLRSYLDFRSDPNQIYRSLIQMRKDQTFLIGNSLSAKILESYEKGLISYSNEMLVLIFNEILILTWWGKRKDYSKKAALIIEDKIYGYPCSKFQIVKKNLSYHGIDLIGEKIPIRHVLGTLNFGDAISQILAEKIFHIKFTMKNIDDKSEELSYLTTGSILSYANKGTIVWGSGFIKKEDFIRSNQIPHAIHCVRGPLTRAKLQIESISCPEKYGDPAILMPLFYPPSSKIIDQGNDKFSRNQKIRKATLYKYGYIPHYIDQRHPLIDKVRSDPSCLFINISVKNDYQKFIDEVLQCEIIVSSSLHGLIMAIAYSKPCVWVKYSDRVIGGTFKFYDFFLSLDFEAFNYRIDLSKQTQLPSEEQYSKKIINIPREKVKKIGIDLLVTNPFNSDIRDNLLSQWSNLF